MTVQKPKAPRKSPSFLHTSVYKKKHRSDIDCIINLGELFISKDVDGKIVIWQEKDEQEVKVLRVPDCNGHTRSRFGVSKDGRFLCAGNSTGSVFIYNIHSGSVVRHLHHPRAKVPIHSCLFSHDCRHLLIAGGEPMIWRWSYMEQETESKTNEK